MKKPNPFFRLFVIVSMTVFSVQFSFAQPTSQTFNASGTYIVPSGYTAMVTIEAWGAGGGGGTNSSGAKGSGGGGAYASSTASLPPGSYTITVGTGGGAGVAGTSSSFTTLVIAAGGQSTSNGSGGAGGTIAASTGSIRIAGNNGNNTSGNAGGAGGNGGNGGGNGGNGGLPNNGSGTSGIAPGGGGGGKAGPGSGGLSGAGANGRVIVTVNSFVLPVRVGTINAFESTRGIELEWLTYGESNMDKYQVEHSDGNTGFRVVGEVTSLNDLSERKYNFTHATPVRGINLYRLKPVDMNGHAEYSSVIRVNLDQSVKKISIYPNQVVAGSVAFSASLEKGHYTLTIRNAAGQQLLNRSLEHNGGVLTQTIQLPASAGHGMCVLQISKGAEKIGVSSFIVL